ncbi:MAG TPA: hypothetical protein VMU38_06640 [Candidatus Binatia bacterium]|nr:hypothetical protein [Candidatus Binatia bacterium]
MSDPLPAAAGFDPGDPKATPPTVTATPSIQIGGIGSSGYHGWLRNGRLELA